MTSTASNAEASLQWPEHVAASYRYDDADGRALYTRYRLERYTGDPARTFMTVWEHDALHHVLYRLPAVVRAVAEDVEVFLVEGEKDADRLASEGHVATTNPFGPGKWTQAFSAVLHGARVAVVADLDLPGIRHALRVATLLGVEGAQVRLLLAAAGKDVSDHLDAGYTVSELLPWSGEPDRAMNHPCQSNEMECV